MSEYLISWEIGLVADTPEEAAQQALEIQRDPNSMATVFDVTDENGETTRVDLTLMAQQASRLTC